MRRSDATRVPGQADAVLAALGGRAGMELAQRHQPDLVALDLKMPEVSGFDVVEALKSRPDTARIPIGHRRQSAFSAERVVGEVQRALARRTH